ncbi:MAG TPA: 7-carboxy-7-deazaguanine synthase QueE [Rhizobiales bacterium]|nr:7-carboxy-7-deazaguanine synthase QueE [Hyphomicrobiales bacterium]
MSKIRVSEIFGPTIQGEGALIGKPTVFVRTGGCDYRCSWCDSLHAVDSDYRADWLPMDTYEIFEKIIELSKGKPLTVSLSGGNPAIQDFGPLIEMGKKQGYRFALETQGSITQDWFKDLDLLILSPKPPSSDQVVDWDAFEACVRAAQQARTAMKIVIFDDEDYRWAKGVADRYSSLPLYIQPGNHTPPPPDEPDARIDMQGILDRMEWLVDKTLNDGWFAPRILPQLHVLLWGNKRGV